MFKNDTKVRNGILLDCVGHVGALFPFERVHYHYFFSDMCSIFLLGNFDFSPVI